MEKMVNKKRIWISGGSGFIGSNIIPLLEEKYEILAPRRSQVNMLAANEVSDFIRANDITAIVHCANPNPTKNALDLIVDMYEGSMKCFLNLYQCRNQVDKILYFGSGAEYGKTADMVMIEESAFGRFLPEDPYGQAKYQMNLLSQQASNVYNLRIFGCFGKGDHESKFITHCVNCLRKNEQITIRKDCAFDYILVNDLAAVVDWFLQNQPKYKDYNVCSGKPYMLSEIAKMTSQIYAEMGYGKEEEIVLLQDSLNYSYTASNKRLLSEAKDLKFTPLKEGVTYQIAAIMDSNQ